MTISSYDKTQVVDLCVYIYKVSVAIWFVSLKLSTYCCLTDSLVGVTAACTPYQLVDVEFCCNPCIEDFLAALFLWLMNLNWNLAEHFYWYNARLTLQTKYVHNSWIQVKGSVLSICS